MTDPSQYVRQREKGARDVSYPPAPEPLAVPVYDNHAHLEIEDGEVGLSLDEQLARATAVGPHVWPEGTTVARQDDDWLLLTDP